MNSDEIGRRSAGTGPPVQVDPEGRHSPPYPTPPSSGLTNADELRLEVALSLAGQALMTGRSARLPPGRVSWRLPFALAR